MPNSLDATGLTVASTTEIVSGLVTSLQGIYGPDINVASNTPDGQLINIFAQSSSDLLELLLSVYNSFSVDNAYGTLLDQRVALNGLSRKQGTYTLTNVTVVTKGAVTLPGLDGNILSSSGTGFTVKDDSGNQFILAATTVISAAGTYVLPFRAQAIGRVQTTPNTITNIVTGILNASSVNNPTVATSTGVDEETDAQLRIRHTASFSLAATGTADSVEAALLAIPDVTDAYVVENATPATVNGVPANSIWAIVTGGTPIEIAGAIYAKKGLGCGQRGAISYVITRPNGTGFTAIWDSSISQNLYIRFQIHPRTTGQTFDTAAIAVKLAAALQYKLNQSPTVGDVVTAMIAIAPTSYQTNLGVSTDGTNWFDSVQPLDAQHYFVAAAGRITIS